MSKPNCFSMASMSSGSSPLGARVLGPEALGVHRLGGFRPGDAAFGASVLARQLGDHLIHRAARRELHDEEVDGDDPNEGGDQQQETADDIAAHGVSVLPASGDPAPHAVPSA